MPVENNIIKAPFSPADVYKLLGVAKRPDGYNVGYIVSDQAKVVNYLSNKKPVVHHKVSPLVGDEIYGSDDRAGISIPSFNSSNIPSGLPSSWVYTPPTGSDPKRLSDFNGYNHSAAAPLLIDFDSVINSGDVYRATMRKNRDSNAELNVSKILTLSNNYFGLVLRNTSRRETLFKTGNTKLVEGFDYSEITMNIPSSWSVGETVNIYGVIYNTPQLVQTNSFTTAYTLNQGGGETGFSQLSVQAAPKDSLEWYIDVQPPVGGNIYYWDAIITVTGHISKTYDLYKFIYQWVGENATSGSDRFSNTSEVLTPPFSRTKRMSTSIIVHDTSAPALVNMKLVYDGKLVGETTIDFIRPPEG